MGHFNWPVFVVGHLGSGFGRNKDVISTSGFGSRRREETTYQEN